MLIGGMYAYTHDLMELSANVQKGPTDHRMGSITTPLKLLAWKRMLQHHPDHDFVHYILLGIERGFQIRVNRSKGLTSAKKNMQSAAQNPEVIEEYLQKEMEKGNILGPFSPSMMPVVHINRFGVIPKKHQPGKWRLITDLSFPEGASVNDAINSHLCSLTYISVLNIAEAAFALGKGALIAKIDIKAAYRLVPISPYDRPLLDMRWKDQVYIDGMLPFGLRSAPKIFNTLTDALEWLVAREGVRYIFHYLDDFAVVGPPDSQECQSALDTLIRICDLLGVPLAPDKQDGASSTITLLGITIDTVRQELRLPEDKLQRLVSLVSEWENKKSCTWRELESLIGTLQHASTVVLPGRSFMRRVIALLSVTKQRHYHIRLNKDFRSDICWWKSFAMHWNGASLLIHHGCETVEMTSDASGSWGCGAWHGADWFQLAWDSKSQLLQIAIKELIPIIIAAVVWGCRWKGQRVRARYDNSAVVAVINSRYSRDPHLMQMLRCLFFLEAYLQFRVSAIHLPGIDNELVDDLSRNRVSSFLARRPEHITHFDPTISLTVAAVPEPGLDLSALDGTVQFFCAQGIADSTRKSSLRRFYNFCESYSIITPFPVSESVLCYYASHLASQRLSPQTIKKTLPASGICKSLWGYQSQKS